MKNDSEEEVTLSGLRGRHVVLYFYPKDDTPGCTKEACGFRDLQAEFERANIHNSVISSPELQTMLDQT